MLVILRGERINCSGAVALFKDNTLDLFNFSKEKSCMKIKVFYLFENKIVTSGKKNEFGNSYQMKRMDKIKFIIHGLKATAMIQINFTVYIGISIFMCCFCCGKPFV